MQRKQKYMLVTSINGRSKVWAYQVVSVDLEGLCKYNYKVTDWADLHDWTTSVRRYHSKPMAQRVARKLEARTKKAVHVVAC